MSHKSLARFIPLSILTALVALTVGSVAPAHGASFTVTATHDAVDAAPGDGICADAGGSCTLRAAVMETNALPGADEISLPAGTYLLSISGRGEDGAATGDLDVADSLTITGAGDQTTAIDADGIDRVLHISGSATVLGLSGVTVTGGNMAPVFDPAILCFPLHYGGGGVCISSGRLNLTDAEVRSNHSDNHGGGVLIGMTATMSAVSTDFHENSSLRSGGAFSNFGIASVSNASINGNRAPAGGESAIPAIYPASMAFSPSRTPQSKTTTGRSAAGLIMASGGTLPLTARPSRAMMPQLAVAFTAPAVFPMWARIPPGSCCETALCAAIRQV